LPNAQLALAFGRAALDDGFFRARWDRATPAEKQYLRALATHATAAPSRATSPAG
jgi:hypothetical protein